MAQTASASDAAEVVGRYHSTVELTVPKSSRAASFGSMSALMSPSC